MADEKIQFTEAHFSKLLDAVVLAQEQESLEPLKELNNYAGINRKLYEYALKTQSFVMKQKGLGEDKAVLVSTDGKKERMVPSSAAANKEKGETPGGIPGRIIHRR